MAAPKKIDPAEIRRLYEMKVPVLAISEKLECNPSTVDYHIDKMGIRRKPRTPKGGAK